MTTFEYTALPTRVVFGPGSTDRVREEVERLGRRRVLVLAGSRPGGPGDRVEAVLGSLAVARFDGAAMHTPLAVTAQALAVLRGAAADCVVAVGGGSTTGLAKALASRTGIDQIVLPTTYAGSEVTPVLGETGDEGKTTRSAPSILPETVIYDVELSRHLPLPFSVASAANALAHAVEALYSRQANPAVDGMALEAIALLARGLRQLDADPSGLAARTALLRGAWLAGACLGAVGMGLHHQLCHVLGGSSRLPHAETHAVVLPHVMAHNAAAAPEAMRRIADALEVRDAPSGVYDLISGAGGSTALSELGLDRKELVRIAELVAADPYPNPQPVNRDGVLAALREAWSGARPAGPAGPGIDRLTDQVVAAFAGTPDPRLRDLLTELIRRLHAFVADTGLTSQEWGHGIDFLTRTGRVSTATRQEFVLLSDVLGLSSAVDLLANSRAAHATPSAVLGPFYVEDPPEFGQGADLSSGRPGTPLHVDVLVTDTDGEPVAGAVVDVWQSDDDGLYDVQRIDLDSPVLRGRLRTDTDGRLRFRSILPSAYPIPTDGPVGELLGATHRHPYRAPHLHFLIAADGCRTLVTQLFVAGGEHLDTDAVFGVKDDLVVEFPPEAAEPDGGRRELRFTFRIERLERIP